MDTSRRGLYLLWHYIKYYFLINFFQDVTEEVSNSKTYLNFRLVLFNLRQTMRIFSLARALRFPRVSQKIQPVDASAHSDYIARAPSATEKVWLALISRWRILSRGFHQSQPALSPELSLETQKENLISGIQIICDTGLSMSARCDWEICRTRPICCILVSFDLLMRYPASHCLRYQDNSQWGHLLWAFSHTDYATHKKKVFPGNVRNNVWYVAIAKC